MKLPKNFKRYLEWSFYLFLFFLLAAGGGGAYLWKTYQPKLVELKAKDPDRFEEMVVAAQEAELPRAWDLYKKIDAMTDWEVYLLRYDKWKSKWEDDPEFREKHLEARSDKYDALKVSRREGYSKKQEQLEIIRVNGPTDRKAAWKNKTPWEQGVLLKEGCLRYRELEQRHSVDRKRMDQPARHENFLFEARHTGLAPSEECDRWITLGHQAEDVEQSLGNLRRSMNYYFFKRMSDDLGLPDKALHSLKNRLSKMTHDYEAY